VRLLLRKKANVKKRDDNENTALILADEKGHSKVVELLERWPVVENNRSFYPQTPEDHSGTADVVTSPDGQLLASVSNSNPIMLWKQDIRALAKTLEGHVYSTSAVAFPPTDSCLPLDQPTKQSRSGR
jgi:WD40 repeat protein